MSTKEIKLTDRQTRKFSAWLSGKFSSNVGAVFNVKSIGEMYKKALIRWMIQSPAKVNNIMDSQVEAIMLDAIGLQKVHWGSYKVVGDSLVHQYFAALARKWLEDNEEKIAAKTKAVCDKVLDNFEIDTYRIERILTDDFEKIVEREYKALDSVVKQEFTKKVAAQLNEVFAEIEKDIDFANPDSLKTEWSQLMAELKIMKGEM